MGDSANRTESVDLTGTELEADQQFQRAFAKYRNGDLPAAEQLLLNLLLAHPDHVGARFGLAMCRLDRGDAATATEDFAAVLKRDPRHHDAAFHLGRAFESLDNWESAITAYQLAAALTDHPGARAGLHRCRSRLMQNQRLSGSPVNRPDVGVSANAGGLPDGPRTVRKIIDESRRAERGDLVRRVHRQARYGLAPVVAAVIILILVQFLPSILTAAIRPMFASGDNGYGGSSDYSIMVAHNAVTQSNYSGPVTLSLLWLLLHVLTWLYLAITLIMVPIRTRLYSVDLHEHGMDIRVGMLRRRAQFIWYYQITEPPAYLRNITSYLTRTASLGIRYNNTASTAQYAELLGIGTPRQVEEIRGYLQACIPPERIPMRGFWT